MIMYKHQLKIILTTNAVDHKKQIYSKTDLKEVLIYCKINRLNNVFGNLIEDYLCYKYCITKNKQSLCNGDINIGGINYEIKCSLGGKSHNKFNFVQIRLNHSCDYYILICYYLSLENIDNDGEIFIFKINKPSIKKLIINHGSYAHGSIKNLGKISSKNFKEDLEYCLRPKYNDKCWGSLLRFRVDNFLV